MNQKTDMPATDSQPATMPIYCLLGACVVVAVCMALYGLLLIPDTPAESPQDGVPLDVEETVLFYQPEEYTELTPLAEVPAEFEYIYNVRCMA